MMARAIPKSKAEPRLCCEAGESPTVIFRSPGHGRLLFDTAARTRSLASPTAVSANPTMFIPGSPWLR